MIAKVVKEIDDNPAADETVFIYHLKNADAANLESTVNVLFNGGSPSSSSRSNTQRTGNAISNRSSTGSGSSLGGSGSSRGGSTLGGSSSGFGGNSSSSIEIRIERLRWLRLPFGGGLSSSSQSNASTLAGQVSIIADADTNSLLVRTSPKYFDRVKAILDELDRAVPQVLIKVLVAEVTHDKLD